MADICLPRLNGKTFIAVGGLPVMQITSRHATLLIVIAVLPTTLFSPASDSNRDNDLKDRRFYLLTAASS